MHGNGDDRVIEDCGADQPHAANADSQSWAEPGREAQKQTAAQAQADFRSSAGVGLRPATLNNV